MAAAAMAAQKWKAKNKAISRHSVNRGFELLTDPAAGISTIADELVRKPLQSAATFLQNGVKKEQEFTRLPQHVHERVESMTAGDLFMQNVMFKMCDDGETINSEHPCPWIATTAVLGRERIFFAAPNRGSDPSCSIVIEDSPLLLIEWIKLGSLRQSESSPTKWKVYPDLGSRSLSMLLDGSVLVGNIGEEAADRDLSVRTWFDKLMRLFQRTVVGEHIHGGIPAQPPPYDEPICTMDSSYFSRKRFLRLTIQCSDLPCADLVSKSDPMCILTGKNSFEGSEWEYLGQTEWQADQQDPTFATRLDIPLPDLAQPRLLRFTLIDVDNAADLPTRFDPRSSAADLLGAADVLDWDLAPPPGGRVTITRELAGPHKPRDGGGTPRITVCGQEVDDSELSCLLFATRPAGCYPARRHALLFPSERVRNAWAGGVRRAMARAIRDRAMRHGPLLRLQDPIRAIYGHPRVQLASGGLVLALFVSDAIQAEWVATTDSVAAFVCLDAVLTAVFGAELLVNLYGAWLVPFFIDPWNVFDLLSVVASLLALLSNINLSTIRLIRAFRVMRLIRRITSLRVIINSAAASLPSLSGALLVFLLLTATFAIMAVDFWGFREPTLARFFPALFTMFGAATGEWSELARGLFDGGPAEPSGGVLAFFYLLCILLSWLVLNVVIAVLLDEFSEAAAGEKMAIKAAKMEPSAR